MKNKMHKLPSAELSDSKHCDAFGKAAVLGRLNGFFRIIQKWAVCGKHLACEYTVVSGGSAFSRERQSWLNSSPPGDDIPGPNCVAMVTPANSGK